MVSPNRQRYIVATSPKSGGYGRYRNMTPQHYPTRALVSYNESTQLSELRCRRHTRASQKRCSFW
ncbi:hypothetical protein SERLA73DRAFT_177901 [Serpula lacrymans var. lacrymans S7.3]|uniref:Uncharacterized protein n=2 Tax=Serpula lacrymans var. lacrymans TaxID=341189 RepID=F8PPX3_SERL3|nr:uncharacterized protein SERLADRAFT_461741 [Serpula lacrymans var. lacrymans S7.9]EGO02127.1 hypothetical protein SERLA73DRAFT_177901 [Serpula lacrymans var. lacrymans S7.3]EGO27751.1 hypothetical protein SERLADRAFT_461741 [Serpula lacrymans var. lacrymans S7.9]